MKQGVVSSTVPGPLIEVTAAMIGLASIGSGGYAADVVGTFEVPALTAEIGHANNLSIPVIRVQIDDSERAINISYKAHSALANSVSAHPLAGVRGTLAMVPRYATKSYMSDFFEE